MTNLDFKVVLEPQIQNNYGDIAAALLLYKTLKERYEVEVLISENEHLKFKKISNADIKLYVPDNKQTIHVISSDFLSSKSPPLKNQIGRIRITEYDYRTDNSLIEELVSCGIIENPPRMREDGSIKIKTGLGKADHGMINSGIYKMSPQKISKEDALEKLSAQKAWINKDIIEKILESEWAFAYSSDIGNDWFFLAPFESARKYISNPITIFNMSNGGKYYCPKDACLERGIGYISMDYSKIKDITLIDAGFVTKEVFDSIFINSEQLSLVTGDISLTQAIMKATPFLYHRPGWKFGLMRGIVHMTALDDKEISDLFEGYDKWSGSNYRWTEKSIGASKLSRLIYDDGLKSKFKNTINSFEKNFEGTWYVNDALDKEIEKILNL